MGNIGDIGSPFSTILFKTPRWLKRSLRQAACGPASFQLAGVALQSYEIPLFSLCWGSLKHSLKHFQSPRISTTSPPTPKVQPPCFSRFESPFVQGAPSWRQDGKLPAARHWHDYDNTALMSSMVICLLTCWWGKATYQRKPQILTVPGQAW